MSFPLFDSQILLALHSLRPSAATTEPELEDALTDVRAAVAAGQLADSLLPGVQRDLMLGRALQRSVSNAALLDLEVFGAGADAASHMHPAAALQQFVSVRSSPLPGLDPLSPDWSRSMRPAASRGPFVSELGEHFWIDTFLVPRLVSVVAGFGLMGRTRLLAKVPVAGAVVAGRPVRLAAGSLWLPSNVLVPGRPANEFVGLAIRGGTMQVGGASGVTADTVTLNGAWRLALDVAPDPPPNPQPGAGLGADASNAVVALPEQMSVVLARGVPATIQIAQASAYAYGSELSLTPAAGAAFYDTTTRSVVIPGDAVPASFNFATIASDLWRIGDSAAITRSGWALPVAITAAAVLGEAAGAGFLWLELGSGLEARWSGLPTPAVSPRTILGLSPGTLTTWLSVTPEAVKQRLELWQEPGKDPPGRSSIELTSAPGSVVIHLTQPGVDAVLFPATVVGHLDRPLAADGMRLRLRLPAGWMLLVDTGFGTTASVVAADPAAPSQLHISFALENALLKVRPPAWLALGGSLNGSDIDQGQLLLRCPHRATLPTLPDPYAANFELDRQQDVDSGWVTAAIVWPDPASASLGFTVQTDQQPDPGANIFDSRAGFESVMRSGTRFRLSRVLLDVSSNADQFGVAMPPESSQRTALLGMTLVAQARDVAVLTLPPISWEPMLTKAPKTSTDTPLPPPPHDGGPALLSADTVELNALEPIPLLSTYHEAINANRHFIARLPLPFGLIAHVQTPLEKEAGAEARFIAEGGAVFLNEPGFMPDLTGGRQLAIRGRPNNVPDSRDAVLPGYMQLVADNDYARGVLSTNIHTRFGGDFDAAKGVPVRRYDLSGYGASMRSDWRDPEAVGPAIIKAEFDVLIGRTSHTVIQMQSEISPYCIQVVRTITMDRKAGGWVLREDSGWMPTSDGRFRFKADDTGAPKVLPAFEPGNVHPGCLEAVVNVRNIQLDGSQFALRARQGTPEPATTWQPVVFDADLLLMSAGGAIARLEVTGGSAERRVPSRKLTGWIHIDGPNYKATSKDGKQVVERVRPAGAAQIFDLLLVKGPASGPMPCSLLLGGTAQEPGLVFNASMLTVSCNDDPGTPRLVAAVRGSPVLPRDGAWSVARMGNSDPAPSALDPAFPVPLIRPTAPVSGWNRWHLADPRDILNLADAATPVTSYGFVQSLGAQKVFFNRPRVGNDPDPITLPRPPQLADMGALLNASSVFPGLADSFDFQALKALSVSNGQIGFSEQFTIGTADAVKEALLADLGGADAIQVVIVYGDEHAKQKPTVATVTVDPAAPAGTPRWSLSLARVGFTVRFKGQDLIKIFATVRADERTSPTIDDLNIRYEGILRALQSIFTNIQQVAKFLPGGAAAGIKIGFSQGRLSVSNAFALPNLPLGAGQITDVAVNMGFDVALAPFDVRFIAGLGSSDKPFRWIVSPLAGTGCVQVAISKNGLDVVVQCGLGLGLAIDLGIAAGAASVAIAMEINTGPNPFELRVILSGRASVDVLMGLASATITLAAGLGIIPPEDLVRPPYLPPSVPPPNPIGPFTVGLTASVAVGIHITVCWVVDVDFDGYWQFRQDISTPAIPIPI